MVKLLLIYYYCFFLDLFYHLEITFEISDGQVIE